MPARAMAPGIKAIVASFRVPGAKRQSSTSPTPPPPPTTSPSPSGSASEPTRAHAVQHGPPPFINRALARKGYKCKRGPGPTSRRSRLPSPQGPSPGVNPHKAPTSIEEAREGATAGRARPTGSLAKSSSDTSNSRTQKAVGSVPPASDHPIGRIEPLSDTEVEEEPEPDARPLVPEGRRLRRKIH
ncbi:hypothetical protein P7C70_g6713, partial [Phenoliferia sp. Uapishka_3]